MPDHPTRGNPLPPTVCCAALIAALIAISQLAGCLPVVLGTTATVSAIEVLADRRSAGQNLDDHTLELKLAKAITFDPRLADLVNINVTVVNNIVLLTGEVATLEQQQYAAELVRSNPQTRSVVNELILSGQTGLIGRANDSWITSKVKTRLLSTKGIPSTSITVTTERGQVYLLGLVTRSEADAAVETAKKVRGVTHVVKVFEYVQ